MGGGAVDEDEHLLIILPFPQSAFQALIDKLHTTYPALHISYIEHIPATGYHVLQPDPLPASTFSNATILMTFADFPGDPTQDAPRLRLLQLCTAGTDTIPARHPLWAPDNGIRISTASGVHGPQIAEWAILTALAHSHRLEALLASQRAHHWDRLAAGNPIDKQGQTVGILGYGSIGRQIGRCAAALGMRVLAHTARPRIGPDAKRDTGYIVPGTGDPEGTVPDSWSSGGTAQEVIAFLEQGIDWLVVAVPLTRETREMLGTAEFAALANGLRDKYASADYRAAEAAVRTASQTQLAWLPRGQQRRGADEPVPKPRPFVTNVSRGAVLVQDQLVEALETGVLEGAALDVTDPEPLPPDSPLWEMPNVIVSPHISGLSVNYIPRCFDLCGLNVGRLARAQEPLNLVRKDRKY